MLWTLIAYFIAPLGLLVWLLLLSGVKQLEGVARALTGLTVSVGGVRASLPMFVAGISVMAWVYETTHLLQSGGAGAGGAAASAAVAGLRQDQLLKRWRMERNWWILNFNLVLWLTCWRLGSLLPSLRAKAT
mmetsp:Transcript_89495/g.191800  ORF Transcript_89495/g.191800 Transcript_89495/m.191800 type:complete len:132 (+) Transcript_89495:65-460(+)